MKTGVIVVFLSLVVFSSFFVSASVVSDFWGKITGKVAGEIPAEELEAGESVEQFVDEPASDISQEELESSPSEADLIVEDGVEELLPPVRESDILNPLQEDFVKEGLREPSEGKEFEACSLSKVEWLEGDIYLGDKIDLAVEVSGDCSDERVFATFKERGFFFDKVIEEVEGEYNGGEFLFRITLDEKWEDELNDFGEGDEIEVTGEVRFGSQEDSRDVITGDIIQRRIMFIPVIIAKPFPQKCTSNVPKKITKSIHICAGTYNQGILVAGDNIQIRCNPGTVFDGKTALEKVGLSIFGGYKNIEVKGCVFQNFAGEGIALMGGGIPVFKKGFLEDVFIEGVSSKNNSGNGLSVSHNIRRLVVEDGTFSGNKLNGMLFYSNWEDPKLSGKNATKLFLFPNDLRINRNEIRNNRRSGIHVDGSRYFRNPWDMDGERNYIAIEGNVIRENFLEGIRSSNFFINGDPTYPPKDTRFFIIKKNDIQKNFRDGIRIISDKEAKKFGRFYYYYPKSFSAVDYIVQNNIIGQGKNGISLFSEIKNSDTRVYPSYASEIGLIYGNVISENNGDGVYSTLLGSDKTYFTILGFETLLQNIISKNGVNGFYSFETTKKSTNPQSYKTKWFYADLDCNDVLSNPSYGIGLFDSEREKYYNGSVRVNVRYLNIIEGNKKSGIFFVSNETNNTNSTTRSSKLYVHDNHIASNSQGIYVNDSGLVKGVGIHYNDIISNSLQAYEEIPRIAWQKNYWSDTSPNCKDSNNDGFCDSPRPIPLNSQDVKPKKTPWQNNRRGYLEAGKVGIDKFDSGCETIKLPKIPPIKRTGGRGIII